MFEAVRIYDNLTKSTKGDETYEVATIAGSDLEGVEADRQLVSELTEVLNEFPATDVILVTDGFTDEMVLPLIESRVPVTSVRRIVIQHSKSIEESAALFTRYMKLLVENPRYSRMVLGLPGVLFIVLGALAFIPDGLKYAIPALGVIIGGYLVIRGFGLDKAAHNFRNWMKDYSPPPFPEQLAAFAAIAGILLILVGGYLGGTSVANVLDAEIDIIAQVPSLIGYFVADSAYLIALGFCVMLSGRTVRWFFEHDLRLWRTVIIMVAAAWSSVMFVQASQILINPESSYTPLIYAIVGGIPVIVSTFLTSLLLRRRYSGYFKEPEDTMEDFEEG
jgi:putative membrane protein